MVCPSLDRVVMKTKVRVDLSKRWRPLFLALYLAILGGFVIKELSAQVDEHDSWRRTVQGWELAHSVPRSSSPAFQSSISCRPSALSSVSYWHRIALPLAVGSFLASFGSWVLLAVPNRGIVRRLKQL